MLLELNSKVLYQISEKEQESCCRGLPSSAKREFRHFHVVVARRRQQNVQKKRVVVLLIKPIAFLPFSLPSLSSLLKRPYIRILVERALVLSWTQLFA